MYNINDFKIGDKIVFQEETNYFGLINGSVTELVRIDSDFCLWVKSPLDSYKICCLSINVRNFKKATIPEIIASKLLGNYVK